MTEQDEINGLKDRIARYQTKRDELSNKYQGARPSHISTDLAMMLILIDEYKAKLAELEGEEE